MKRLPPLLSYYGSKYTIAPLYPRPKYKQIIEPFAGGASYSLCHADHDVLLVDKYEKLIAVWQFLIAASPAEILAIPLLTPGQTTDDIDACQEARWLVGWWLNAAVTTPCKSPSKWARWVDECGGKVRDKVGYWGERCRARIAATVPHIKHWRAVCADYREAPDIEATWFIDAPYYVRGNHYRHGAAAIDFGALATWCTSRSGHVLVCENEGAPWLPFQPFAAGQSCNRKRENGKSLEVLWTNDGWRMPQPLSLDIGDGLCGEDVARAMEASV